MGRRWNLTGAALLAVFASIGCAAAIAPQAPGAAEASTAEHSEQTPFFAEMTAAMDQMMTGMKVMPTGDVDADFASMMIPHHQGAIDMAVAELRYGKNEQLRRIAQEIIVDQQQEIAAMRRALGQPLPPSVSAPTQVSPADDSARLTPPAEGHSATSHGAMPMPDMTHSN